LRNASIQTRENRGDQAPDGGSSEIPVNHFRDHRRDDQHKEKKSISESLQRRPINGTPKRGLDIRIRRRKFSAGNAEPTAEDTTAPAGSISPRSTAL